MQVSKNSQIAVRAQQTAEPLPTVSRGSFPIHLEFFKWSEGALAGPLSGADHFAAVLAGRRVDGGYEVLMARVSNNGGETTHWLTTYNPRLSQVDPNFIKSTKQVLLSSNQ